MRTSKVITYEGKKRDKEIQLKNMNLKFHFWQHIFPCFLKISPKIWNKSDDIREPTSSEFAFTKLDSEFPNSNEETFVSLLAQIQPSLNDISIKG